MNEKEKWMIVAEDADDKQEKRFETWMSGEGIPFEGAEAEAKYRERVTLIRDAVQMKKTPHRVPICPAAGHFPIEHAGITFYDAMYDFDALAGAWRKFFNDFDPDSYSAPIIVSGKVCDLLDMKLYRWPGHGVGKDQEYQFVEDEYMKAEEYPALIDDPSGFHLKTYFPRVSGTLKPFEKMPFLRDLHGINSLLTGTMPFGQSDMQETLQALVEAGSEALKWMKGLRELNLSLMGQGYPSFRGGRSLAPFDVIGDSLRGTRGILTDMYRRPDLLLEACERYVPFMIDAGVRTSTATGNPMIFMPLHKGADTFMSRDQFKTFYWPSLRKVVMGLIQEGLIPVIFAEAGYESRLDIISDVPAGKTVWWFEQTDMAKAKETVGKTACIAGNVPNALFRTGGPEDMRDYCKNVIEAAGEGGGFILSTAASLQGARPENVKAMIDAGKEYGIYGS